MSERRVRLTDHAADRYLERIRPDLHDSSARALLERAVQEGDLLKRPPWRADWRLCKRWTRFVEIDSDHAAVVVREGRGTLVVVTVLERPRDTRMAEALARAGIA